MWSMCAEADLELAMRFQSVHAQIDLNLPRGFESARGQAHVARSGLSVPLDYRRAELFHSSWQCDLVHLK